jgi:hypothetical protein
MSRVKARRVGVGRMQMEGWKVTREEWAKSRMGEQGKLKEEVIDISE